MQQPAHHGGEDNNVDYVVLRDGIRTQVRPINAAALIRAQHGEPSARTFTVVDRVRVNAQERGTDIKPRPVEKFNEQSRSQRPLIRKTRE